VACAQDGGDNPDSIFQAPPLDAQGQGAGQQGAAQQTPPALIDQLTTQTGIKLRGSFDSYAGFLLGWTQAPDPGNLGNGFSRSPALGLAWSVSFEARPSSSFRALATLTENYPDTAIHPVVYTDITPPTFSELFCDYTVSDTLFFRIGKQVINWGATRFFPFDNLPARTPAPSLPTSETFDNSAGIGFKVSIPFGLSSLSAIAQLKNGYFADPTAPHLEEVGVGLLGEWVIANTELSLGGYCQKYLPPRVLAISKTTILGMDARAGALVADRDGVRAAVSCFANAYWEQPDVRFHVLFEYIYNAEGAQPYTASAYQAGYSSDSQQLYGVGTEPGYPSGHAVALLTGFKNVGGSNVDVGVQWEHLFSDNSGVLIPAVLFRPFEMVTLTLGLPLYYGGQTSDIMALNPDPVKRQVALGLKLDVSTSF
jgi:hypothetical protein